eukprot:GFUD01019220.1.p1 GENE.GFUD01019220.1~~GFUD01019220.1.p1  ORF type:complete len:1019 (+),score=355.36 GFUD01019220.1:70-3057(+)
MSVDDGDSPWFSYLLDPSKLTADIESGATVTSLQPLLLDLLSNLLNNQTAGFFADNPQELWYAKNEERKCSVLRNLCLRLAAFSSWSLGTLEKVLPSPLLLYLLTALVQAQPGQEEEAMNSLASTIRHTELDLKDLAIPGPSLQALTLLHRWVVRTFMVIRTPMRTERTSTVMVPGVRRDPAVMYRDQTHTLVSAVAPTSIKFLQAVLDSEASPTSVPSHSSFPATVAVLSTGSYSVPSWDTSTLMPCDPKLELALAAHDLGCCYFFCEDYDRAKSCFSKYFTYTSQLSVASKQQLDVEVEKARLAGYLICLDLPVPEDDVVEQTSLAGKIIVSANNQYDGINKVLEEDNLSRDQKEASTSGRELLELELREKITQGEITAARDFLPSILVQNMVRRTLRGLPLSSRVKRSLTNITEKVRGVLEDQVGKMLAVATDRESKLLKCLVVDLVVEGILGQKSKLVNLAGIAQAERAKLLPPPKFKMSAKQSFVMETFGLEKITKLNTSLQMMSTFSPGQVVTLANSMGVRGARKTSSRWMLETEQLNRPNLVPDLIFILLAKVNQLKKMKRWSEARLMLDKAQQELRGGLKNERFPPWLGGHMEGEHLLLEHLAAVDKDETVSAVPGQTQLSPDELLSRTASWLSVEPPPTPALVESSLLALLNAGDWEAVGRLSHPNMGYVVSSRPPHTSVILLARNLAFLMLNLRANNPQMIKKFGRDVWEMVAQLVSNGGTKRPKDGGAAAGLVSRERAAVTAFLCQLAHEPLKRLTTSLIASLFNVARDDPNTDILSPDSAVWPTGLATNQAIQERTVEDMLTQVITSAIAKSPKDPTLLRMLADIQFANSRYSSALSLYVETTAVKSDFFQLELGSSLTLGMATLEESVVGRLVTCARELGRLTQAVVLSQFSQEPNYAQAFKFLEDRSLDGSDSLYGCIWDMAVLEFAMSLHTKRGEVARRREALHCIWQLELNTNNDEEIIKEAANVRKAMFLRSLAMQFF